MKTMKTEICPQCGWYFEQNARGTKKYCSDACKVAAHRAKAEHEDGDDLLLPVEKAIETKRSKQLRSRTCPHCHMYFHPTAAQGKRRFCSDKCKMAYHRSHDYWGTYAPKKPLEAFATPISVEVTYNEQEAIRNAWIEGLEQ